VRASLPKVRPSIPGALAKLPAWILGAEIAPGAETSASDAEVATAEATTDTAQLATTAISATLSSVPSDAIDAAVSTAESTDLLPPISPENIAPFKPPPDWAPSEEQETQVQPTPLADEAEPEPEWLSRLRAAVRSGEVEDSTSGLDTTQGAETLAAQEVSQQTASEAEIPPWLKVSVDAVALEGTEATAKVGAPSGFVASPQDETVVADSTDAENELPAWLQKTVETDAITSPIAATEPETPSWLAGETPSTTEPTPPNEQTESLPEWLEQGAEVIQADSAQTDAIVTAATVESTEEAELPPSAQAEPVRDDSQSPAESAIAVEERILPDPQTLLTQARELAARGETTTALETYEKVFQRAPALTNDVIADLEQLVSAPNAPKPAHRLLGDAYAMAGRFKEALEQYRVVLSK
jgi:hypothetical protein